MPRPKERKSPKVGASFEKTYKGKTYTLTVVKTPGGTGYKVNGEVFTSPSTAAKSITGSEVNGWVWWGMEQR